MAQQFKDLALSLMWQGFDPWPGNFHTLWAWPKKKGLKLSYAGILFVGTFGFCFVLFCFVFCPFRAISEAYGGSQARGRNGAVAASLRQSHSNAGLEPHLQPTPQLMAVLDP